MAAVRAHFAVPASSAFVRELAAMAAEPAQMRVFEASEAPIGHDASPPPRSRH